MAQNALVAEKNDDSQERAYFDIAESMSASDTIATPMIAQKGRTAA